MKFRCSTRYGNDIKLLISYLNISLKQGTLNISRNGISIINMDSHKRLLVDSFINAKYFDFYELNNDQPLNVQINFSYFEKILKTLKKTDCLELSIDDSEEILNIKIIPKDRISEMEMSIEKGQMLNIEMPDNYINQMMIHSNEIQSLCRDIKNTISSTSNIKIQFNQFLRDSSMLNQLVFSWNSAMMLSKSVKFGNNIIHEAMAPATLYEDEYNPTIILNIAKLNINRQIHFHVAPDLPLKLEMKEENYRITIFIKSNKMLEAELEE